MRGKIGEAPILGLIVADVLGELGQERGEVHVEDRRLGKHLDVAHPTEPLIALGTIVGRAHQVAALGPEDVPHEPVQARVRALEPAHPRRGGMKDPARDRVGRRRRGQSAQLDIAKAVVGKARFEPRLAIGGRDELIHLCRCAEIGRVDRAVGVEHLRVPHHDGLAGFALRPHAAPADHVLAHIVNEHTGLEFFD